MTKKRFPVQFNTTIGIHDLKSKGDFICTHCLREFAKGDRIVVVGTYDINEILQNKKQVESINVGFVGEHFYHIACWKQWFDQKIKDCVSDMQKQLLNNPAIKQAMSLVGGLVRQ